jgi:hypothetical protein
MYLFFEQGTNSSGATYKAVPTAPLNDVESKFLESLLFERPVDVVLDGFAKLAAKQFDIVVECVVGFSLCIKRAILVAKPKSPILA